MKKQSDKASGSGTRIHYEIPTQLHRQAKAEAAIRGLTLKDFVIGVLRDAVTRRPRPAASKTSR